MGKQSNPIGFAVGKTTDPSSQQNQSNQQTSNTSNATQNTTTPAPPAAKPQIRLRLIAVNPMPKDKWQLQLEVIASKSDGKTIPRAKFGLIQDGDYISGHIADHTGRKKILHEVSAYDFAHAITVSVRLMDYDVQSDLTWTVPKKGEHLFVDPDVVEVRCIFVTDNDTHPMIDLRLIRAKGRSLAANINLTQRDYPKINQVIKTNKEGHAETKLAWSVAPGETLPLIVTVDGITAACEMHIFNAPKVEELTSKELLAGSFRKIAFWLTGIPALLFPVFTIKAIISMLGTSARVRVATQTTQHDSWLFLMAAIGFAFTVLFIGFNLYYRTSQKTKNYLQREKFKKSRYQKASSKDSNLENLFEVVHEVMKDFNIGQGGKPQTEVAGTFTASGSSNAANAANTADATRQQVMKEDFWNEMKVQGIFKGGELLVKKLKTFFK